MNALWRPDGEPGGTRMSEPAVLPALSALRAEWTKLRTLAGTWWLLLAVIALTAAVGTGAATAVTTTLTAMPRRSTVLAAKTTMATGLALAAGAVGVLASVLAGRLILPGHGFTAVHGYPSLSLANGPDLRAAAGSVLYLALIAVLALGVATVVRDSAVSIGLVLAVLYLFPVIASALGPDWSRRLAQIGPMTAGLSIQATTGLRGLPLTPWQGLGVLALWAAGALVIGGLALRLRDA